MCLSYLQRKKLSNIIGNFRVTNAALNQIKGGKRNAKTLFWSLYFGYISIWFPSLHNFYFGTYILKFAAILAFIIISLTENTYTIWFLFLPFILKKKKKLWFLFRPISIWSSSFHRLYFSFYIFKLVLIFVIDVISLTENI